MADERPNAESDGRGADAHRYRVAAEETLAQLDWCVNYLHSIRKRRLAAAIARNRNAIRRRMQP